jgi:hypothetical protein
MVQSAPPVKGGVIKEVLMTEAELTARRNNAQLSTGPRTSTGKKRSSLNAFRHGLTGQIVVQTPEDQEAFNKHCDGIRKDLDPEGALETTLAQAIAEDYWRLNRVRALENGIFALGQTEHVPERTAPGAGPGAPLDPSLPAAPGCVVRGVTGMDSEQPELDDALAPARTWMAHAHELHLLALYESRISRSVEKNTAQLRALRADRKYAPLEAELQQYLNARSRGEDNDPAGDPAPENPKSSVRFFKSPDPASNQSDPASNQPDPAHSPEPATPPARPEPPGEARETKEANPPQPTRQPTMQDVYDILGWQPGDTGPGRRLGDEWVRNPIGQTVWRR